MRRVGYWLESLEHIGALITRPLRWFVLIMVLTTVAVVVLRYALETGAIFLQESVMYLHGLFFMLALAFGIAQDTHVRVDILYSRMSSKRRNQVNLIGHCVFCCPWPRSSSSLACPMLAPAGVLEGSAEVWHSSRVFVEELVAGNSPVVVVARLSQQCGLGSTTY